MELFRLFGSIMIDDKDAIKALNSTEKKTKDAAKQMEDMRKKAAVVGKAIAVGIGVGVTALTGLAMKATEATDRIDKMSLKVGLSRRAFQEWDYILSQNGISIDSMQAGMNKLTNLFDDLGKGSKTATESFGRLGLTLDDLSGKSKDDIFNIVISKLQGITNETERAAIANDIFGKSGAELAPLLNAGAEATELLRKRAHELGIVLDDEAIDAGVKFGDTFDDVKKSFGAVGLQIGVEFMPVLQGLLDWILVHMPEIKQFVRDTLENFGKLITWVTQNANWLIPTLTALAVAFMGLKVIATINTLLAAFNVLALANPFGAVIAGVVALGGYFVWLNGKIQASLDRIAAFKKAQEVKGAGQGAGNTGGGMWTESSSPGTGTSWSEGRWNADGGIFSKPTIFNTRLGMQGVGEAGPEAIMPLSKLQDLLDMNTIDYDQLAIALKRALRGMTMQLDNEKVGEFVDLRVMKGAM
jgi:hypothetical protein